MKKNLRIGQIALATCALAISVMSQPAQAGGQVVSDINALVNKLNNFISAVNALPATATVQQLNSIISDHVTPISNKAQALESVFTNGAPHNCFAGTGLITIYNQAANNFISYGPVYQRKIANNPTAAHIGQDNVIIQDASALISALNNVVSQKQACINANSP